MISYDSRKKASERKSLVNETSFLVNITQIVTKSLSDQRFQSLNTSLFDSGKGKATTTISNCNQLYLYFQIAPLTAWKQCQGCYFPFINDLSSIRNFRNRTLVKINAKFTNVYKLKLSIYYITIK